MLNQPRTLTGIVLSLALTLFISTEAAAQVPDSTYKKPELPTGPPVPVEQPRPQPRQRVQEQPKPEPVVVEQQQPEVVQEEQVEVPLRFIDKLYIGGSFGLQFGSFTSISLLPTLSYAVTPKFYLGVGGVYHYESGSGFNLHHFGGRGFTQLEMFEVGGGAVLAHAEVEALSIEVPYFDATGRRRTDRSSLTMPMVGLGYRQRISDKGSFDLLVLYNGNDDPINPYSNPVIRAGFNIGLTRR
ncbi:hypothetical protein [Pontibacter actiniarum]|uniref:Outer membrane protein beta-barrel domain-containing protein n=1 Tax=Pontibacter actiniarum TaxID=323450 RepID=A0A1X9YQI0_9BACT|nr:hypothetical protein [Pontibacter actiniarum]ARS35136.1 hypothetical protein CA264_06585 [Pontibacter actiniarum]